MSVVLETPWRSLPRRIRLYIATCFVIMFATPVLGMAFAICRSTTGNPL